MNIVGLMPIALALAAARGSSALASRHDSATACYAADANSNRELAYLTTLNGGTDSNAVRMRNRVHLPVVSASAISVVTDSLTCADALATYNRVTKPETGPATHIYLIAVGSVYVAFNPNVSAGEWTEHVVMDSTFHFLADYLR